MATSPKSLLAGYVVIDGMVQKLTGREAKLLAIPAESLSWTSSGRPPSKAAKPTLECPVCGAKVTRLARHLSKAHSGSGSELAQAKVQVPDKAKARLTPAGTSALSGGKTCACGGNNPNCYRCDGLGLYVEDTPTVTPQSPPARKSKPNGKSSVAYVKPPAAELERSGQVKYGCELCLRGIFHEKTREEINRPDCVCNPLIVRIRPEPKPVKPAIGQVKISLNSATGNGPFCPVCGCQLSAKRISRHMAKVHLQTLTAAQIANVVNGTGLSQGLDVRASRVTRIESPKSTGAEKGTPQVVSDRDQVTHGKLEHQLDASKDYASNFREAGRFGSHASHDDYGEEAEL